MCVVASFAVFAKVVFHSSSITFLIFHVVVPNNVNYRRVVDGNTLANVYCINCRILLGWELIAVAQPSQYYVVGRFFMRLKQIMYLSGVTLHDSLFGGANEQAPNQQDGGAIDQVGGVNEQNHDEDGHNEPLLRDLNEELGLPYELVPDEQVLGGNEQNADRDGNANEQIPTEQDLGANEPNADQDGEFNEQVPNEQDVDVNEQNADLDGDNEQNHDQDEGGNDQNNDEDGSPQAKRRKM
ncbi:hypothetical protein FXO38_02543 [Capsicum annuum]|nr:hypothetical protein FXO38_02543 [Capsicum annuum]